MRKLRRLLLFVSLVLAACATASDHPRSAPLAGWDDFGLVNFPVTCSPAAQRAFPHAIALLHSAAFEQALAEFQAIAQLDPKCAMAYWGQAMTWWRPLQHPPDREALERGAAAIRKAESRELISGHEKGYVGALAAFYAGGERADYRTRTQKYRNTMERLHRYFPKDNEVSVFYAVALLASASAGDKQYGEERAAAAILERVFGEEPNHPGAAHYLIHCFDHAGMAKQGLLAAESYARTAPPVAHDLHLPSHIFVRLGLWQNTIDSNLAAAQAAQNAAQAQRLPFVPDQQLHAMDYLIYAYLQQDRGPEAEGVVQELNRFTAVQPTEASYYAMAAIPARYAVERGQWKAAAELKPYAAGTPETQAITHWARALGAAHGGNLAQARAEIEQLQSLHDWLGKHPSGYDWATQVEVQRREAAAWLAHAQGNDEEAQSMMRSAVELEGSTEKSVITPGPVLPAHDLMADLLMELHRPREAFQEYKASLAKAPHRFHAVQGATRAAEESFDHAAARRYRQELLELTGGDSLLAVK